MTENDEIRTYGEYEVHPSGTGAWSVVHNGQVRCMYADQDEAIEMAKRLADEED